MPKSLRFEFLLRWHHYYLGNGKATKNYGNSSYAFATPA
jgi:hypothetical protein